MQPLKFPGDDFFDRPAHLISRASRQMNRIGEKRLKAVGFSVSQLPVLAALKHGARMTQKELAELVHIEQPSMAQLIDRMKRDGLVTTQADPEDKRKAIIHLSPAAVSKLPDAAAILLQCHHEALKGMSADEVATLSRLLKKVVHNLAELAESRES